METSICAWAPWWSADDRRRFLSEVEGVVGARFGEYELDEAAGTVTVSDLDCVLGLSNLAQACRMADAEDWRLLIYSHMTRLDDFAPEALSELLGDYERVKGDLRVRVVSHNHIEHIDPVGDPLPLGMFSCLSVALDGATMPVDRSHFDEWGEDQDEVMAAALANTLAAEEVVAAEIDELKGRFTALSGDSLFTSALLLGPADAMPDVGEMGAVVAVPTARDLLVCPISATEEFVDDSATMLAAGYVRFLSGPNSVSPNALWWRPGEPLEAFARLDSASFELAAPPELRYYLQGVLDAGIGRSESGAEGLDI
ncbi:hypothetical protein [Candidatus Poriferisocius sp.]|uniref:hypothetical protein n=1 Tax=Candidatus Poriferisocius sp. TaxID=3101276 RepID=UPI003B018089